MAYAPLGVISISGSFVERDCGHTFEYIENPEYVLHTPAHGGKNVHFPHLIFVGPFGQETRRALVKGSVVHVVTDETDNGYTIEKWNIKNHRKYAK
jgi:hypothetical protein